MNEEHSIIDGKDSYSVGYRLGRKLYTDRKIEYRQIENHEDRRVEWMNDLVSEALEMAGDNYKSVETLAFEAGFHDGFSKARGTNVDGNIKVA